MSEHTPETGAEVKRRRGIYLLPNLFTTAGLFAGFYAIVAAMHNRYEAAAIAIFVAMVADGLDGRVARLTNTQSDFGKEYDSLSDMIAFGLAPALVIYQWTLTGLGKFGWLAAFMYAAATALRLARFNTQHGVTSKRYFQGLASPAAAATVGGMVWVGDNLEWAGSPWLSGFALFVTVSAAVLMVSNIPYRSFKDLDLKGKVPFIAAALVVFTFVLIAIHPIVLFAIAMGYAASGPLMAVVRYQHKRRVRRHSHEHDAGSETDQR